MLIEIFMVLLMLAIPVYYMDWVNPHGETAWPRVIGSVGFCVAAYFLGFTITILASLALIFCWAFSADNQIDYSA